MTSGCLNRNFEIITAMYACIMIMVATPRLNIIPFSFPFLTLVWAAFIFSKPGGTVAIKAAEKVTKKSMIKCVIG
jgi:hypothetical protein